MQAFFGRAEPAPPSPPPKHGLFGRELAPPAPATAPPSPQRHGFFDREPAPPPPPPQKQGFFYRSSPPSVAVTTEAKPNANSYPGSSFFFRRRSDDSDSSHMYKDPSIVAARQKVHDAEEAEAAADRALYLARLAVKEVRDHLKNMEKEFADEAKRAKAKQAEAKSLSKSARGLGRHGKF